MLQTSGGGANYQTGLFIRIAPKAPILIQFFFTIGSIFLANLSFFGFVSQFIYRFAILTRINRYVKASIISVLRPHYDRSVTVKKCSYYVLVPVKKHFILLFIHNLSLKSAMVTLPATMWGVKQKSTIFLDF